MGYTIEPLNLSDLDIKDIEAFSMRQLSTRLYLESPKRIKWTKQSSESLNMFLSIIFKSFIKSTRKELKWQQRRKKWELDSVSLLQLHRGLILS